MQGHRRVRSRAGVRGNLTKCIKNLCFSTITKTKGYKSGGIYKTRRYCFTCKQVPDGRGDKTGALRAGESCAGLGAPEGPPARDDRDTTDGSPDSACRWHPHAGAWDQGGVPQSGGGACRPGGRGAAGEGRARAAGSQVLAALQLGGFLSIGGGGHADVHHVVAWGLVVGRAVGDLLL